MKKILTLGAIASLVMLMNCTNTNDEDELGPAIVINVNDFSGTIDENPNQGDIIGVLNATASTGTPVFTLVSQTPDGAIEISQSGEVSVSQASLFDFEVNQQITAIAQASLGGVSAPINITISINDVAEGNDGLVFNDFEIELATNLGDGDEIGTLSASSTVGEVSFSLTSESPEGAIEVNSATGIIRVADAALFDSEINPVIRAEVSVTDGVDSGSISVTITLIKPPVIWTGAIITFTKSDGANPNAEENQDRITDNVWITRGNSGGQIYNAKEESSSDKPSSPADTEWAVGTTSDIGSLTFLPFRDAISPKNAVGVDMVLHLITDDIYIDVKFTQWSSGRRGGFAYERSTEPD